MPALQDLGRRTRQLRNLVEPIAAAVFFVPEAHDAYVRLGFPVQSKYSNSPFYWRLHPLPAPALRLVFRPTLTDTHQQYGW